MKSKPTSIDEYHEGYPESIRVRLESMRSIIKRCAPGAIEKMAYGIPTFYLKGNLVHYGGYDNHIGFYPAPSAISAFEYDLKDYKRAKGSVQFPHERMLPEELIERMVEFRVRENCGVG